MANILTYLEKIIYGVKTNTFLQILTLLIISATVAWNIMYSPDEREEHEMIVKAELGLVDTQRSFKDEFEALNLSQKDYDALQNDFELFICKLRMYQAITDKTDIPSNCPIIELLPICDNEIKSLCHGEIDYDDSSVYLGEIVNDEPNGFGVLTYSDSSYWGSWKDSNLNGYGYLTDNSNRVVYRGQFKDSLRYGKGEAYEYEPFLYYSGTFLNDYQHGKGTWVEKEFIYNGEIAEGNFSGTGKYFDIDLIEYDGMYKYGKWHGRGIWKDPGIGTYDGDFKFGLFDGTGTMNYENGDVYEGSWYRDTRHGLGKYIFKNGDSYSGKYKFGLLDDEHAEVNLSNQTCRGGFQSDKPHGYHECYYTSGTYSKTNYLNGLNHGLTEWSDTAGTIRSRTYSYGLENGPAKDIYPDKTIYEYNYENGRVVGKRIEIKDKIIISVCNYDDEKISDCVDS